MPAFVFDRTYHFPVPGAALWDAFTRVDAYREWWPWLRSVGGDGLVAGGVNDVTIWAPVPWTVRLRLTVVGVEPRESVAVAVTGDLAGAASLVVAAGDDPSTSTARLQWRLAPASPPIRLAARVARPVLQTGQDWVVGVGVGQFRRRALRP